MLSSVPYRVPFYSDVVRAHLQVIWPSGDVLEHFYQMLHQKFRSHVFLSLPSRFLESAVHPAWMDLLFQRLDSIGPLMGGYAHTC
jgi:hypothetical protein